MTKDTKLRGEIGTVLYKAGITRRVYMDEAIDQLEALILEREKEVKEKTTRDIAGTFFGHIMTSRMAREFRHGDGTGKEQPDYEQVCEVFGDWIKKQLTINSLEDQGEEEK